MLTLVAKFFIKIYQWTLAPIFPDQCKYQPTCSEYAIGAINRHGFLKGIWLACKRIARCHPWTSKCGYDPVPDKERK
jgi:putative membrane protein insertion efficiency factor